MKRIILCASAALAATCLHAALVDQVVVRQQWPWSTDIKVEYALSGVTAPVDLTVRVFDGATEFEQARVKAAIKGETYGITGSVGSFTIDPVAACNTTKAVIDNLTVKIEVSDSPANINEVLYKIFDLTTGACEDVTRKALLNGKYGSVETDFSKIGDGFNTTLSDVIIWTGVTNDVAYKTDKLVMRKIPAKDVVWTVGSQTGHTTDAVGSETTHKVKLTEDYYIAVFEMTQDQYHKITSWPTASNSGKTDSGIRPMENLRYDNALGVASSGVATPPGSSVTEAVCWPTNSYLHLCYNGHISSMRKKTGVMFTLPTEAQWEFACRAGTATDFNSGKNAYNQTSQYVTDPNIEEVAWTKFSTGYPDATNQTMPVGLKKPNAFGLYDMHGNVLEMCLDAYVSNIDVNNEETETDPIVNPIGDLNAVAKSSRIKRGGSYYDDRTTRLRSSFRNYYYGYDQATAFMGFRLVCPVVAEWEDVRK